MKNLVGERATLAAFLMTIFLAGFNGLGVRLTVEELPPFWGAVLRFVPAFLILAGIAAIKRLPLPSGRNLLGAVLYGVLNFGANYSFLYWGLQKVQAGTAGIFLALVPLFTLIFAVAQRLEPFRLRALFGSLLSLAGIAVIYGAKGPANAPLAALLAITLGSVCFAEAGLLIKRFPGSHPVTTNMIGMAVGSVILFLMSMLFHEPHPVPVKATTWGALIYLILFGSCAIFILTVYVLNRWPASTVSYSFVIFPFIGIAASAWLDHEKFTPWVFVGAVLVVAGVYFGSLRASQKRAVEGSPAD
ncbi:permease of the drug/metabolite transporter (DMT) superfamily [Longilinea arvoryzae]|uniref:Permease of the drug/metabolite transporter (DMT) superfamily n=1 Tax=Longilinea arvoryzae TaxID=360412 RepID=A0A0S7BBS8_9CHLR|nr:EamA family transporter [Longilinea arvoryzae]GAP12569.1 permease of the drug/metabolite transporter (DMT) superfamily [Longilinea arvoryzae]